MWLRKDAFLDFVDWSCARLENASGRGGVPLTHLQLSRHTELRLTSLEGARHLLKTLQSSGIRKSIDQQFNDPRVMGRRHRVHAVTSSFAWRVRPWILGRSPNSADGHIYKTRRMTWTELALLRLLTQGRERVQQTTVDAGLRHAAPATQ